MLPLQAANCFLGTGASRHDFFDEPAVTRNSCPRPGAARSVASDPGHQLGMLARYSRRHCAGRASIRDEAGHGCLHHQRHARWDASRVGEERQPFCMAEPLMASRWRLFQPPQQRIGHSVQPEATRAAEPTDCRPPKARQISGRSQRGRLAGVRPRDRGSVSAQRSRQRRRSSTGGRPRLAPCTIFAVARQRLLPKP